jgi:hypothetical protein
VEKMTEDEIKYLKSKVDNGITKILFHDGEEVTGKIISVSESEKDIIYDLVSTNRPRSSAGEEGASVLAYFNDIKSVL